MYNTDLMPPLSEDEMSPELREGLPVRMINPTLFSNRYLLHMVHAVECRDVNCCASDCKNLKTIFQHASSCKLKKAGGCPMCKQMFYIRTFHVEKCEDDACRLAQCNEVKLRISAYRAVRFARRDEARRRHFHSKQANCSGRVNPYQRRPQGNDTVLSPLHAALDSLQNLQIGAEGNATPSSAVADQEQQVNLPTQQPVPGQMLGVSPLRNLCLHEIPPPQFP